MRRTVLKISLPLVVLAALSLIHSCGDDGTRPLNEKYSFSLTVTDDGARPLAGLTISRTCGMIPSAGSAPEAVSQPGTDRATLRRSTAVEPPTEFFIDPVQPNPASIEISVRCAYPEPCLGEITIRDWKGENVSYPASMEMTNPGYLILFYNLIHSGNHEKIPCGIYYALCTAIDRGSGAITHADSVYFSVFYEDDAYSGSIGTTDAEGFFSTGDRSFFPSLQGHQPQISCDVYGIVGDPFMFNDTVEIKITTHPPSGFEGYSYWMTRIVTIDDGPNEFEWVFVPEDSVLVTD